MKSPIPAKAKIAQKSSDDIITRRYIDLKGLRDEVRKAELSCTPKVRRNLRVN